MYQTGLASSLKYALEQRFFGELVVDIDQDFPGNYIHNICVRWSPSLDANFCTIVNIPDEQLHGMLSTFCGAPLFLVDMITSQLNAYINPRRLEDRIEKLEKKKTKVNVEITIDE